MPLSVRPHSDIQPGVLIGPWCVRARWDGGSFGVVFCVERAGHPEAGPFALKLAVFPEDPRFAREVELLQRVKHPSVPRFEDKGRWMGPDGWIYPYVVMEWVEGTLLYKWGREQTRTSGQVLRVLAQLAHALAVAHAAQGLHRDVKGDNVLVTSEGRAVLLDWGCATYEGAEVVTDTSLPPGTHRYRTPEALRWARSRRGAAAAYEAGWQDDVYALGVMAYRLCTGKYPPSPEEESGPQPKPLPPRELATVSMSLERLVLSALSEEPDSRPHAVDLAAGFSAAALEKDAARPIVPTPSAVPTERASQPGPPRENEVPWWLFAVSVGVVVVLASVGSRHAPEPTSRSWLEVQQRHLPEVPDAGVGEEGLASLEDVPTAGMGMSGLGREMPKRPYPAQRRPPCEERGERAINGACWLGPLAGEEAPCGPKLFDYDGRCYAPSFEAPRQPTSEEPR